MLNDIKLYEELLSRSDPGTKYYKSYVDQTSVNFGPILENIKVLFPDFPDHGIQHSIRILRYLSDLLSEEFIANLTSLEIVILIFVAFFHDSGMCLFDSSNSEKEELRANHSKYAKVVIDKYFAEGIGLMKEKERIKNAIVFVCEAHGFTLDELVNDERFNKTDRIDTFKVRYNILAFLLRIGDLMDIESDRSNSFRMVLFNSYLKLKKTTYDHNVRNHKILQYDYDPNHLIIRVYAEDNDQFKIWVSWFSYLKADIERFDALFGGYGFHLPYPDTEISLPEGQNGCVEDLRFEIDEKGGMWDVISKSIYTNELDFLREIIQNAIDASLKRVYLDDSVDINNASPMILCFTIIIYAHLLVFVCLVIVKNRIMALTRQILNTES